MKPPPAVLRVVLTGTPFTLNYQSDRVPGRTAAYTVTIPLSGSTIPASLQRIDLTVQVAGQTLTQRFAPQPNLSTSFTWDGKDAYGRRLSGRQPIEAAIEFVYPLLLQLPAPGGSAFGQLSGVRLPAGARPRSEVITGRQWRGQIGAWDQAVAQGLGGMSLSVQHAYDPMGETVYFGNGTQRSATGAGNDDALGAVAGTNVGTGSDASPVGDGGPASAADLSRPFGLATDAAGNL